MPTGKLAKWQILLSEFDMVYVTQKEVKGQALTVHLAENPVGGEYESLNTYFPDEKVSFVGEYINETYDGWRMFFDGVEKFKGGGIGAVLVLETGQHYPVSVKLRFPCTNNMEDYEACIMGLNLAIDMNIQELLVIGDLDLLVKMSGSVNRVQNDNIENHGENDVVVPIAQRLAITQLQSHPKTSSTITPEATPQDEQSDRAHCFKREQVYLGSYGYFTKWVKAVSYKAVTKKVVADFVRDQIVCWFGVLESIITDNASNLNSNLMKTMCEPFKIKHKNSTAYRPQMNGAVEATNKNIKKILRKMVENHKQWHEKLPFSLLGYRITVRKSTGATPYLLIYCTEVVIPAEVEIPSLRIMQEAELSDAEWIRNYFEKLALIDGKE
ncbi:uncharacterized protein [Nicotiana sylvestris]|uniref:uncharacterized protein n=1 Tax=Nicotiana sylvestris TaxID=4096 RepID=UPI00388C46D4